MELNMRAYQEKARAEEDRRIERFETLSVVIPALNEEDGIAEIVQRVRATESALKKAGIAELEIIVVDDGSSDRTAEIAASLPNTKLVRHETNRGYGAAIKTGFAGAKGDLLAFLDADSTYPPEFFADLCRELLTTNSDIAVGSRRSGSQSEMPRIRRLGNLIWSSLVSLIGNQRVADPASGMRVLRKSALPKLYPLPDGLNFTPVMSTRTLHEGLGLREIPIPYHERSGRSKLSVVKDGTRFLKTIIWTALEYNPVRILGLLGSVALGGAAMAGLAIVVLRLQGITELGPWGVFSVFVALLLGVVGVSMVSLGISFNYFVALFHRRPVEEEARDKKPIFAPTLDRHFGWFGALTALGGLGLGATSLILGLNGWEINRLWLWLVGSALFTLMGLHLFISWVQMRVLEALSERQVRIFQEMGMDFPREKELNYERKKESQITTIRATS